MTIGKDVQAAAQLDAKLLSYKRLTRHQPPRRGWLFAIRSALHMPRHVIAKRLGTTVPSYADLERSEAADTISLRSLRRAADALGCDMVCVLVPRRPLRRVIEERAAELARQIVSRTDRTMRLEAQGVNAAERRRTQRALARDLAARTPRRFWHDRA